MSKNNTKFYINGEWVDPVKPDLFDVINPATEEPTGQISLGCAEDVDRAVKAARAAFPSFSQTSKQERLDLLDRIIVAFERRFDEIAAVITAEMGSPLWFAKSVQADTTLAHFKQARVTLRDYDFGHMMGTTRIVREAIGVCGFITPWELADQPDRIEVRSRTGGRLHGGDKAQRSCAPQRDTVDRGPA